MNDKQTVEEAAKAEATIADEYFPEFYSGFVKGAKWQSSQQGWIDVNERLPEMPNDYAGNKASNPVLVWNGENIYKAYCEAVRPDFKTIVWDFAEEHGCPNCGQLYTGLDRIEDYSGRAITHWMPLPNPPTPTNKNDQNS